MKYYTKEHEWIELMDGTTARVGITEHAQDALGDIVFIDFVAAVGPIQAGEEVLTVESVKSVSDVYAPVAGTIQAFNERLQDEPDLVNADSLGDGWMFELECEDPTVVETLLTEEQYNELLQEEE